MDPALLAAVGIVGAVVGATGLFLTQAYVKRRDAIALDRQLKSTTENVVRQLKLGIAIKKAEFRQAWINDLRDAMSKFQSYGVTPDLDHKVEREFYELGTKIELMMNRRDKNFESLQNHLYQFLNARHTHEKFAANAEYVELCQDILKNEWEVLKHELDDSIRQIAA